jgi:hypothetical protein
MHEIPRFSIATVVGLGLWFALGAFVKWLFT